jgi:hypothetical protein
MAAALSTNTMPASSRCAHLPDVDYWFRIILMDDTEITSQKFSLTTSITGLTGKIYKTTASASNWYAGDIEFGQEILDVSEISLQSANKYFRLITSPPFIFMYTLQPATCSKRSSSATSPGLQDMPAQTWALFWFPFQTVSTSASSSNGNCPTSWCT